MVQSGVRNDISLEYETDKPDTKKIKKHRKEDFALILTNLKGLAIDVKEILSTQNAILMLLNQTGDHVFEKKFSETYNLSLPFQSQEEFDKFNGQLHIDDEFRNKFISSLNSLLDRELALSKSLTNICKQYLSRDLAMKYTVLRKVPGKSLLKDTLFYDCVIGVIIQTHKDPLTAKKVSQQVIDNAIGRVMNNAKDWNGQRQTRAQSVKAAHTNNIRQDGSKKVARESADEESDQENDTL